MTEAVRDELATLQQQGRISLRPSIFMEPEGTREIDTKIQTTCLIPAGETMSKKGGENKNHNSKDKDSLQQCIVLLRRQRVLAESVT